MQVASASQTLIRIADTRILHKSLRNYASEPSPVTLPTRRRQKVTIHCPAAKGSYLFVRLPVAQEFLCVNQVL